MPTCSVVAPSSSGSFRSRAKESGVTEQLIRDIVVAFYDKIRVDAVLGPIFLNAIGHDWDAHIERIISFWLAATWLVRGYDGKRFMPAHLKHQSIRPEHLPRWLALFDETLQERCDPQQAAYLIDIARRMAENIEIGLARRDHQNTGPGRSAAQGGHTPTGRG